MPRGIRNYENGKIYKLVNDVTTDEYIGSTLTSLSKRKAYHKGDPPPSVKVLYDEIGWDQLQIVLIEAFPCENNDELRRRERYWFDDLKPVLNQRRPHVTVEESKVENLQRANQYRADNPAKVKQYYIDNKAKMKLQATQYRIDNKDRVEKREKQYRIDNKDKIKRYHTDNVAKINARAGQKINCVCGAIVRNDYMHKHKKTFNHIYDAVVIQGLMR